MATLTIKKNGEVILSGDKYEKAREALAGLMTTQNPGSKGVESAVKSLGGKAYTAEFAKAGKPSDVFEVYEEDTLTAKGLRGKIARKMEIALSREDWLVEVFTVKSEKKSAVAQEIPVI